MAAISENIHDMNHLSKQASHDTDLKLSTVYNLVISNCIIGANEWNYHVTLSGHGLVAPFSR